MDTIKAMLTGIAVGLVFLCVVNGIADAVEYLADHVTICRRGA
ncbi:hypothetical protein [Burkholderia cepacia]|nr:hypothetical protein [Burkholderia cepacia]